MVPDLRVIGVEDWYVACHARSQKVVYLCEIAVNEVTQYRGRNTCAAYRASQERNIPCICGRCF